MKVGMNTVTVSYANSEGCTFNKEYYLETHIPLVKKLLGNALKGAMVEYGIAGGAPDSDATFICKTTMYFDTIEDFQNSFGPNAPEILADLPNFTNVEPSLQINKIAELVY